VQPPTIKAVLARLLIVLIVAAIAVPAASARDPRLERLRLNSADTALAHRIALRAADLGAGWTTATAQPEETVPSCPGYRPDFSRFTLTGRSLTSFGNQARQWSVASNVEVYASQSQARAEWKLSVSSAAVRCFADMISRISGISGISVASARVTPAPRLGDTSAAFEIVLDAAQQSTTIHLYIEGIFVRRGRTIAALYSTAANSPVPGFEGLARRVAARM
jgi:hypothetical protein